MASKTQHITLSLNLNCSRATAAYKAMQKEITEGEKQLAEMHKKVNGTSYAEQFPDVELALNKRLKAVKAALKHFQGDYADLNQELIHIQSQSTARLQTLIRDTQARMDSLNFDKQRKEWLQLAKIRGEFERELKSRNSQQSATQQRSADRIVREAHSTEQEIEMQKKLQLAYAEADTDMAKYQKKVDMITRSKARAIQYTQDLAKAQQDYNNAQAAASANPTDPALAKAEQDSLNWLNELQAHPKKMPTAKSEAKATADLVAAQGKMQAAQAAYNTFMKTTGNGPIQGSITKLTALYEELKVLRNATSDPKEAKRLSGELEQIKKQIDTLQTAPIRSLKDVLRDLSSAQSLQQLEALRTEMQSIMHNSTNVGESARAKRELEDLEVRIKNYGQEYMKLRQIKKVVAEGDRADVNTQKEAIRSLERLSSLRGTTAEQAKQYKYMIDQIKKSMDGLYYDEKLVRDALQNIHTTPIANIEKAVRMVEERMKGLGRRTKEYVAAQRELKTLKSQLDGMNQSLKAQGDWLAKAITKLANYVGIFGGFYLVKQEVQQMFQANIKYDDSLSNIRKTTQLTSEAVAQLADNIKRINTRTSLEDITNLAYAAGRLGVKGTADIMGFVRAADQINIALGEQLNGQESVEQLMKITNLMGANQEYGLEQALLKTGSAINELTMNSTATAQPMVDFMKRTAGIATQSGITTAQLTGLAGAVNSLGQNVEMSATSISKMLVQISSNSQKVAKALKMSDEEATSFFYDIKTGNMMDAFLTVLEKTREAGGLSHLGTIVKDLGSEGQRVIQTIATLSSNYEKVREMVNMSTKAFEEGTSATNEYNLKNQNTAALWEKLKNQFSKMWVSTDMVGYINRLLVKLQDLPIAVKNIVDSFSWLKPVFDSLVFIVTKATWALETFVQVFLLRAAARQILVWKESIAAFDFALIKTTLSVNGLKEAWKSMNAAMKLNVITAIATAILAIYHAMTDAHRAAKEFEKDLAENLERAKTQAQQESQAIGSVVEKIKNLNSASVERADLITQLNSKYGDYLENLLTEKSSYEDIATAMEAVNRQLKMKAILDAEEESLKNAASDMTDKRGEKREKLITEIMKYMVNPDRGAAAQAANDMIANRGKYLTREYSSWSNVYDYTLGWNDPEKSKERGAAFREAVGGLDLKSHTVASGGTVIEGYGDIMKALEEAADVEGEYEAKVERIVEVYEADAKIEAQAAQAVYESAAARQWKDVEKLVTQNGRLRPYYNEEGSDEPVHLPYATKEDQKRWADDRDRMTDEQRNETIVQLDEYIKMEKQLIEDLKRTDPDRAVLEAVNFSNAEQAKKIFQLGRLENKDENDKEKSKRARSENKAAEELYNSIMDNIRDFYKNQEIIIRNMRDNEKITATQMDMMLEQNNMDLLHSQAVAEKRIIGETDLKSWTDEMDAMAQRNIAGSAGEYVLNLIRAVADPRNIGLIFARTRNAVLDTKTMLGGENKSAEQEKEEEDAMANMTEEEKKKAEDEKKAEENKKLEEEQGKTASISTEAKQIVATHQANAISFINYAIKKWGLTPEQAAGFAGVLMEESRINPKSFNASEKAGTFTASAANGPEAYGAGIAQWSNTWDPTRTFISGKRKDNIISILQRQTGKNYNAVELFSLNDQMEAMAEELSTRYPGIIELLKQQKDTTAAADIILRGFENGGGGNLASTSQIDKYTWNAGWSDKEQTNKIGGYAGSLYGVWKKTNGGMSYIPGRAELGTTILGAYNGVDLSSYIVGNTTRTLAPGAARVAAEGNAFDAKLRLSADTKEANIVGIKVRQQAEIAKMWLEDNPFGEISEKFQAELERMGIMLAKLEGTEKRKLVDMEKDVMSAYLKIGENVSEFDMDSSEGIDRFREYISQFPDLAQKAQMATVDELAAIYYKTYQFAEEFNEKIAKSYDKNRKIWENMYKKSAEYNEKVTAQNDLSAYMNGELHESADGSHISLGTNRATRYGGSQRLALRQTVSQKSLALENARGVWENNKQQAQSALEAAQQIENPQDREVAVAAANEQLRIAEQEPAEVTSAVNELVSAMGALQDATNEWASSMVTAFETVMDGLVPLRSYYDDKGSFVENVFGTKQERQEAFGSFVDDVKKTLRKAMVEKTKEKVQEAVLNAVYSKKALLQKAKDSLISQGYDSNELTHKQIVEEAKVLAAQKSQTEQSIASASGTTTRENNDTSEATVGMWGNFGKAISAAWADGGPFLGAALAAVVGATLSALMTMVFNMMGKGKSSSSSTVNTKLVSGMLTYDKGNVQSFGVKRYDSGLMPILADNGRVYMAATDAESTGLITRPTLTNIGGVPALVGEEGPEMVIGRETTRALQMNRPDIMAIIQAYDSRHSRGYAKAYDSGNASSVAGSTTSVVDMQQTLAMLNQTLTAIQQNGIQAKINKYGRGGLIDEVTSGIEQTQRVGSSQRVKRIFG